MKHTFKDNPLYKEVYHSEIYDIRFYMPANGVDYAVSRYVAGNAYNVQAACGATKELLEVIADKLLELANEEKNAKNMRGDVATLANNLKYRLKYPIDDDVAIRFGANYTFMEGEDPDTVHDIWTQKKVDMAKGSPDGKYPADGGLYAFFLSTGLQSIEPWKELKDIIPNTDYFLNRRESLRGLMPSLEAPRAK